MIPANFILQPTTTLIREAATGWKLLNGITCVYKQPGISLKRTAQNVKLKLCEDLNSMERLQRKDIVEIRRLPLHNSENENQKDVIAKVEDGKGVIEIVKTENYADHPLVVGPGYLPEDIRMKNSHHLGKESSGVTVFGINTGCREAELISRNKWLKTYIVSGQLGIGTDTFYHTGKILEKAKFQKIQKHMVDRILSSSQTTHQRMAFNAAGVRLDSERAYELASKGLVRPEGSSVPIIYSMKCTKLEVPFFDLELSCINETEQFLWQFVHELGLKLHSVAVCTKVRCVKIGPFGLEFALLPKHCDLENILQNMNQTANVLKDFNLYERQTLVDKF